MSELRSQELYMLLDEGGSFSHGGSFIHEGKSPRMCKLYGNLPVWRVRVTELAGFADKTYEERRKAPGAKYWAWWEHGQDEPFKRDQGFEFVWRSSQLVEICFGGGSRYEERRGRGLLLPVTVEPLELALP